MCQRGGTPLLRQHEHDVQAHACDPVVQCGLRGVTAVDTSHDIFSCAANFLAM